MTPEKRSLMMKWARESVSKQYQDFKQRRMEIRKAKNEKRSDKIEEARKKESRTRLMKEKLCAEISKYSGLWLTEEQIETKLAEMKTDSEKRAALKCQLQFRQKVISMFPSNDKKRYYLSEKGQVKSVKELTENLKTLLRQSNVNRSSAEQNLPIAISQNKLHEEKDRLKKLCQKEVDKLLKKKQQPFAKKRKPNEDLELNGPIVTSVEELVGKKVQHLILITMVKKIFLPGAVVCHKPNSDNELVIHYDCEDYILLIFLVFKILS